METELTYSFRDERERGGGGKEIGDKGNMVSNLQQE